MEGCPGLLPLPGSRGGKRRMDIIGVTHEDSSGSRLSKRSIGRSGNFVCHMDSPVVVIPCVLGLFPFRVRGDPIKGGRWIC